MAVKKIDWDVAFEESLRELRALNKGESKPARTTVIVNPLEVRRSLNVNRPEFAALIGVSERTVESWEQGRTRPTGAARSLLRVAARNPKAVLEALR
jgi:putative transcriptional regulator